MLSTSLRRCGRARLAQPHGLGADRVEDRVNALAHVLGARGEHDQLALLGGLLGPRHRGVDERDPGRRGALGQAVGGGEPDRAHLDEHGAVQRAERLRGDRLDGRRVGQHRHDHVGAARPPRHAAGDGDAVSASGSAFSRERFQALTSWPAAARLRAIGAPMIPVPRNATRISSAGGPRCRRAGPGRGGG